MVNLTMHRRHSGVCSQLNMVACLVFTCGTTLFATPGCVDEGGDRFLAGIVMPSEAPFGPRVVFEPTALPIPEVPLPNDILLERDPDGSGVLQWNVSTRAPTALERGIREDLRRLDGFGAFGPVTVSFDGPLDLGSVNANTVRLVNISVGHPEQGREVPLDLGRGAFPLAGRGSYWPFDPFATAVDFLLPPDNNIDVAGVPTRVEHYEVETNTLLIRPRDALSPGTTYAVLLTRGIVGQTSPDAPDGAPRLAPIRSPFPFKAHAAQAPFVAQALAHLDLEPSDLAFGWTFTTGRPAARLTEVRDGLHGEGRLSAYAELLPPTLGDIRDTGILHDANGTDFPSDPRDHRFIVQGEFLDSILGLFLGLADGFSTELGYVDYVAFGSFPSLDVRTPDRGVFSPPKEPARIEVPYLVAVPKETGTFKAPFPVVIYFHGTSSSRFEFLSLANNLARVGVATVAYDQVGHGPIIPDLRRLLTDQGIGVDEISFFLPILADLLVPDRVAEFEGIDFATAYRKFSEIGLFAELALIGRTTDLDGDGAIQSGESFFFADPFQQCGAFQQDLVDLFALVRALRHLDSALVPPAVDEPSQASEEALRRNFRAGDLNADGRLDFGGPDVNIGLAGISLGGFHALMGAALEPEVTTTSPIAAGGGVADILLRSNLRQITRLIYLDVFGPLVVACPDGAGGFALSLNNESGNCGANTRAVSFGHVVDVGPGTRVVVRNRDNAEIAEHVVDEGRNGFALAIPSDRWDQLTVTVSRPETSDEVLWVLTPYQGLGLQRNTPEFRRFVSITQHALDPCDPIAFARHIFREPLPGHAEKHVLYESVAADVTVPISTSIALARATGLFGEGAAADAIVDALIAGEAVRGRDFDIDGITADLGLAPEDPHRIGPIVAVQNDGGQSAIRFAFARGRHEWVAGPTNNTIYEAHTLTRNRIALFHATRGRFLTDDLCITDESCPLLDDPSSWVAP